MVFPDPQNPGLTAGRILSFLGGRMIPPTPLEKGGNRIGSPPFEGGFRGIELELEATPPPLKYAPYRPYRLKLLAIFLNDRFCSYVYRIIV